MMTGMNFRSDQIQTMDLEPGPLAGYDKVDIPSLRLNRARLDRVAARHILLRRQAGSRLQRRRSNRHG
jgi:hypothetical protein